MATLMLLLILSGNLVHIRLRCNYGFKRTNAWNEGVSKPDVSEGRSWAESMVGVVAPTKNGSLGHCFPPKDQNLMLACACLVHFARGEDDCFSSCIVPSTNPHHSYRN